MRYLAVCIALVACKDSAPKQPPPPVVADAAVDAPSDWKARCAEALAQKMSPVRRIGVIIEGCQPCGDWKTLLDWKRAMTDGGPPEAKIEAMMVACKAYCSNDSKMQFMGAMPDARDKSTNKPWRLLGEKCGEAVSALPDARFMSAPFFALDRIARAASEDPKLAPLVAGIEIPLPPVSLTGVGFELPTAAAMTPDVPKWHITVTQSEIRFGTMPVGKLGANGITVYVGKSPYPGEIITEKELAQKLSVEMSSTTDPILLIAPTALPASRVADVVKALGAHEVFLAVAASGAPTGWSMPGAVPVRLDWVPSAKATEWKLDSRVIETIADLKGKPASAFDHPRITIAKDATVTHLATLLGALGLRDAHAASLTNARK